MPEAVTINRYLYLSITQVGYKYLYSYLRPEYLYLRPEYLASTDSFILHSDRLAVRSVLPLVSNSYTLDNGHHPLIFLKSNSNGTYVTIQYCFSKNTYPLVLAAAMCCELVLILEIEEPMFDT